MCLSKIAEVSDDLESFLHVIIYYAVRFLHSNISDVPGWLEEYFDFYVVRNQDYYCGSKKKMTIMLAELTTQEGGLVWFGSPMDILVRDLIGSFQAYYIEKTYDEYVEVQNSLSSADSAPSSLERSETSVPLRDSLHFPYSFGSSGRGGVFPTIVGNNTRNMDTNASDSNDEDEDTDDVFEDSLNHVADIVAYSDEYTGPREPTGKERMLALNAKMHEYMYALFVRALNAKWPPRGEDRAGDRVPVDWRSQQPFGPVYVTKEASRALKRQRSDHSAAPVAGNEDTDAEDEID